jgi:hypothetical protein
MKATLTTIRDSAGAAIWVKFMVGCIRRMVLGMERHEQSWVIKRSRIGRV